MGKARKLDVDAVRQAAAGRWVDVLMAVGSLPGEALDGQHHPCPKCGGTDRFRLIDEAAGAVLCSQCFGEKNGDGFAAVGWSLGLGFVDAVGKIADYLGVASTPADDPAKDLKWMKWSSPMAAIFCNNKKPITEAALLAAGARMARYKDRFTVIALPVIGQELNCDAPTGWVIYNYNAAPLPKWNKQGEVTGQVKVKVLYGSKAGLMGVHGIERLKTPGMVELVWKVEGPTDMLALMSAIPESMADRHVVVTNANGAGETPRWPATVLAAHPTCVLHDADKPGQEGAAKWSKQIAGQSTCGVRNVSLPYEIEEKNGKDLRDYLLTRSYADLLALADLSAPVVVARTASGEINYENASYPIQDRILKTLQIEVLYEEESGAVRVFSTLLRKSSTIRLVEKIKQSTLIQVCGPPAMEHVVRSASDAGDDQWTMEDIRNAISLVASNRRGKNDERGIGVWQGLDDFGNETETIVLVGNAEGARWNGDKVLRKIIAPRADGLVLDFGASSSDWYDFDTIERYLAFAQDPDWRRKVISESVELFSRWRWRHQDIDPTLLTGLVLATWIQTIWSWRPLVAINGESNSGKSFLFEALGGSISHRGLFGALAFKQARSSEAGVRQGIGNTGRIMLCDEFEHSNERKNILEKLLRPSTRGEATARGTGDQKGMAYRLRHIGWVAAIETGLKDQPDSNRFIQFELKTARKGDFGKLKLPDGRALADLGQRLLCVAVNGAIEAKALAMEIKDTASAGIDSRAIESYSVPAAILAVSEGQGADVARALLQSLLLNVDKGEHGRTDQDELLSDVMTASVFLDGKAGTKTVGQVLESTSLRMEYAQRLESVGVRLMDDYGVFIAPKLVSAHLLRGSSWEGKRIDQILLRLPGTHRRALRVGGRMVRGVEIPPEAAQVGEEAIGF